MLYEYLVCILNKMIYMTKDQKKTRITLSVPDTLILELDKLIKDDVLTRSQFVLVALKEKIEKEKAKKEIRHL